MVNANTLSDLYAQLEQLPEQLVGEIVEGELSVSPRPGPRHTLASSRLGASLIGHFDRGGQGGWWILDEPELHLGADVLVPDLAGWRRDRLPVLPDENYFTLSPDWVCEILSPRTAALDRARKMPIYAREGVPHLWLIDPLARTLEVFRLQGTEWLLQSVHEGGETAKAPPFETAALSLADWWPSEAPLGDEKPSP